MFYLRTKLGALRLISSKVVEGSQILKLGRATLTTPILGLICHEMIITCCDQYVLQIWYSYH